MVFNNHPNGNAVANAFEMIKSLNEKIRRMASGDYLKSYPRIELANK